MRSRAAGGARASDRRREGQAERLALLKKDGYPAYTTSVGWFGYSEEKIRRLSREALADGWTHFKLKVGGDAADDLRRGHIVREEIGWTNKLMVDANQKWGVARSHRRAPASWPSSSPGGWKSRPTPTTSSAMRAFAARCRRCASPPASTSTTASCSSSFFRRRPSTCLQLDSCRVAGVNENLAIILLAAKFNVPVCPHAGGVGLCEYVQHLSAFDFLSVSASLENRVIEFVDHLHEHFVDPVRIRNGRYLLPEQPGYSIEIRKESLTRFAFPDGEAWSTAPMKLVTFSSKPEAANAQSRTLGASVPADLLNCGVPTPGSARSAARTGRTRS